MTSPTPTAFEVRTSGLYDVTTSLAGNNLTVQLGTLDMAPSIVITTNPALRSIVQSRYPFPTCGPACRVGTRALLRQTSPPSIVRHPDKPDDHHKPVRRLRCGHQRLDAAHLPVAEKNRRISPMVATTPASRRRCSRSRTPTPTTRPAIGCVVTNNYGNATSDPATLTVNPSTGPTITQHPAAQGIFPGGAAAFTVTAVGNGTLTYQWQRNQADLTNGGHYAGVTTPTLIVSTATRGRRGRLSLRRHRHTRQHRLQ